MGKGFQPENHIPRFDIDAIDVKVVGAVPLDTV
jgi:hypothetical protein